MNPLEQSYSVFLGFETGSLATSVYQACVNATQETVSWISSEALAATCADITSTIKASTRFDLMGRVTCIAFGAGAIGAASFKLTQAFKAKSWAEIIDKSTSALFGLVCGVSAIAIPTIMLSFDPVPSYGENWHSSMTQALPY